MFYMQMKILIFCPSKERLANRPFSKMAAENINSNKLDCKQSLSGSRLFLLAPVSLHRERTALTNQKKTACSLQIS